MTPDPVRVASRAECCCQDQELRLSHPRHGDIGFDAPSFVQHLGVHHSAWFDIDVVGAEPLQQAQGGPAQQQGFVLMGQGSSQPPQGSGVGVDAAQLQQLQEVLARQQLQ